MNGSTSVVGGLIVGYAVNASLALCNCTVMSGLNGTGFAGGVGYLNAASVACANHTVNGPVNCTGCQSVGLFAGETLGASIQLTNATFSGTVKITSSSQGVSAVLGYVAASTNETVLTIGSVVVNLAITGVMSGLVGTVPASATLQVTASNVTYNYVALCIGSKVGTVTNVSWSSVGCT